MSLSLEERVASLERSLRVSNEQIRNLGAALVALQSASKLALTVRRSRKVREAPAHKAYAKILFDGGSRGNPGLCGAGYVIYTCSSPWTENSAVEPVKGKAVVSDSETNNYAEYSALILALRRAKELGFTEIQVLGDSKLVINQQKGEWTCGPKLRDLYNDAATLIAGFNSCVLEHIPRAQNTVADGLANEAMDGCDL
jgi:ribonuclease HI